MVFANNAIFSFFVYATNQGRKIAQQRFGLLAEYDRSFVAIAFILRKSGKWVFAFL
jgi:hypothetical protein